MIFGGFYPERSRDSRTIKANRMIFSNYDRQSIAFFEENKDEGYHFTFDDSKGIIDENEFSSCTRHDTSKSIEDNWNLSRDDGFSFMIGSLKSPCFNGCYSMDPSNKLGKTL